MDPSDRMGNTEINTGAAGVNASANSDLTGYLLEVIGKLPHGSTSLTEKDWTVFFRHFGPQVRSIARSIVHNPAYVADVEAGFQERSWKSLHTFTGTTLGELTRWVHEVAHNLAVDVGRAHGLDDRRQLSIEDYESGLLHLQSWRMEMQQPKKVSQRGAQGGKYRVCDVVDYLRVSQFLERKLRYLSPNERACVKLRAEGYTNPEIAAQLDISLKTVACHVSRGCKKLVAFIIQRKRASSFGDDRDST